MATVILFGCPELALSDLAAVVVARDLSAVVIAAHGEPPVMLLVGSEAPPRYAEKAIDLVVRKGGYFLRLREGDSESWIRRLVEGTIRHSPEGARERR